MKIHCKILALALTCCLLTSTAMAEDEGSAYVTISAGQSYASNACQSGWIAAVAAAGGTGSCSSKSVAYRAGFGYQYTPMWGLEVNYGQFGYASSDGNVVVPGLAGTSSYAWQLRAIGLALQATATLHMGDALSVFGKFGIARVEFDERMYVWNINIPAPYVNVYYNPVVNAARNTPALGAGVQLDVTPHSAIRAMVETFGSHDIYNIYGQSTKVSLRTVSVGYMYKY